MGMVKCTECKEKISNKAKTCPSCGAPAKKKTSFLTWLITIFIVLFVLFAIFSKGKKRSVNEPTAPTKITKSESKLPDSLELNRATVKKLFQGKDEPTAKDALWTSDDIFKVGVLNDGTSRDGYASYVCEVLYENGFRGVKVWVQVIDIIKLTKNNEWVKLGESHCK